MAVARQKRENILGEFMKASVRSVSTFQQEKIFKNKWRLKSSIKVATSDLCIVVYKTDASV
jgi:hypothetical protein